MAITNGYTDADAVKAVMGVDDEFDTPEIELAVEAASRQIDDHCGKGRKFWQDASTVDRSFYPSEAKRVWVDDISTTDELVVKVDTTDDGSFDTTLTIDVDFIVEPVNAAAEFPVRPYESIRLLDGTISSFQRYASGRPFVQVTAKFGWSAVPDQIERACAVQARHIFKAADTTFGVFQLAVDGLPQRVPTLGPMVRAQLEGFVRYAEVDDHA